MSLVSKLCAVAAVLFLVLSFVLRGSQTLLSVILVCAGIVCVFLSLAFRE